MAESGAISGYPDGTFRPSRELTRGQLTSLLARSFDLEAERCDHDCVQPADVQLSDISGSTHEDSIRAVVKAGIASGYPDGTFQPDRPVSREQLASLLAEAAGLQTDQGTPHPFGDVTGSAHEWAIGAISAAGITAGSTADTFAPKEHVRRDQMPTFLDRTLAGS